MSHETSTVRTAVVGCGYWGKNLVRTFNRLSDLRCCCDSHNDVRARTASAYPSVKVTADYDVVLADPAVDAVVLATPAATHAPMAMAALRAGKHVFVEKPLALNVADAEGMVHEAEASGRILMVGHLLEYHPVVGYIKQMIDSGELGEVYYAYAQRVNLGKVRSQENALWSLAPHDISMILRLMGEEPIRVAAAGQAFLQPGVEDVVLLTLGFPSGRNAHIHVSWLDPHRERRLTVVGSRKMVVFDDVAQNEKLRVYDKGVDRPRTEAAPYETYADLVQLREGDILIPRVPASEPLAVECAAFLRAVETGEAPLTDGSSGLAVVRVLESAQRSLEAAHLRFADAS